MTKKKPIKKNQNLDRDWINTLVRICGSKEVTALLCIAMAYITGITLFLFAALIR